MQGVEDPQNHAVTAQEDGLNHSQSKYRQLMDSIDGIVWETRPRSSQFAFVSKQAERILGYPVQQWLEDVRKQDNVNPDDWGRPGRFG